MRLDPGIGEWTSAFPQSSCDEGTTAGDSKVCFTAEAYFREVFVRSDTSMTTASAAMVSGAAVRPASVICASSDPKVASPSMCREVLFSHRPNC
jgi:hypothetical protein